MPGAILILVSAFHCLHDVYLANCILKNLILFFVFLILQIHDEAKKFSYQTGVKVVVAYGGAPIHQQVIFTTTDVQGTLILLLTLLLATISFVLIVLFTITSLALKFMMMHAMFLSV